MFRYPVGLLFFKAAGRVFESLFKSIVESAPVFISRGGHHLFDPFAFFKKLKGFIHPEAFKVMPVALLLMIFKNMPQGRSAYFKFLRDSGNAEILGEVICQVCFYLFHPVLFKAHFIHFILYVIWDSHDEYSFIKSGRLLK